MTVGTKLSIRKPPPLSSMPPFLCDPTSSPPWGGPKETLCTATATGNVFFTAKLRDISFSVEGFLKSKGMLGSKGHHFKCFDTEEIAKAPTLEWWEIIILPSDNAVNHSEIVLQISIDRCQPRVPINKSLLFSYLWDRWNLVIVSSATATSPVTTWAWYGMVTLNWEFLDLITIRPVWVPSLATRDAETTKKHVLVNLFSCNFLESMTFKAFISYQHLILLYQCNTSACNFKQ